MRKAMFFLTVFAFAGSLWAQQDARIGTWKQNVAKSTFDPGPPPKSGVAKFEPSGSNGIKLTFDGVNAQGNPTHNEYTANYDGKDYPIKGSAISDTVAIRRIDANTHLRIDKKSGNVAQMMRGVVSKDGKTFTVISIGINAQGQAFHEITVYDRQ